MPSAKSSKSSNVHHPPSNRAFALRMMNSSNHSEGRVSPLDKALKPFRDSFKKSSKNKKSKEKSSPPATDSHSDLESKDEESFDSAYEVPSPTYENHHKDHDTLPWTSQGRKSHQDDRQHYKGGDSTRDSHGYRSTNVAPVDYSHTHYHQTHAGYREMADIIEEDEFYYDNEKSESERLGYHRHENGRHGQRSSEQTNGQIFYHRDMHAEVYQNPREYHRVELNATKEGDGSSYFVAPNGEIVKLREKKGNNTENRKSKEQSSQLETLLPERFGKRLSMLCHVLAEKYPEDFHILELLVELQVSNEKREEEMNKSVTFLKKKVDHMEERLLALEGQSAPGFKEMLIPLAAAAEAFSAGVQKSLMGYLKSSESCKDVKAESPGPRKADESCKDVKAESPGPRKASGPNDEVPTTAVAEKVNCEGATEARHECPVDKEVEEETPPGNEQDEKAGQGVVKSETDAASEDENRNEQDEQTQEVIIDLENELEVDVKSAESSQEKIDIQPEEIGRADDRVDEGQPNQNTVNVAHNDGNGDVIKAGNESESKDSEEANNEDSGEDRTPNIGSPEQRDRPVSRSETSV